ALRQRDLIRILFTRRAENLAALRSEAARLRNENSKLLARVAVLQEQRDSFRAQASDWKRRYGDLRSRFEAILHRFKVLHVAKAIPRPLRRFVRERLLGPAQQR